LLWVKTMKTNVDFAHATSKRIKNENKLYENAV